MAQVAPGACAIRSRTLAENIALIAKEGCSGASRRLSTHYKGQGNGCNRNTSQTASENAVWNYPVAIKGVCIADVRNYVAVYWDKVDAWVADEIEIAEPSWPLVAGKATFVSYIQALAADCGLSVWISKPRSERVSLTLLNQRD